MGKISKILINSLMLSSSAAEIFQVTGCNNENLDVSMNTIDNLRLGQDTAYKIACFIFVSYIAFLKGLTKTVFTLDLAQNARFHYFKKRVNAE